MRTWERVDLPAPLGPMTAWTSPLRMTRSTPLRISRPCTDTCRSSMRRVWLGLSLTVDHQSQLAVVDDDVVDRRRPRRRKGQCFARLEAEHGAVLPALDRALVGVDLAFGERVVGVCAGVADGIEIVVDAHDGDG